MRILITNEQGMNHATKLVDALTSTGWTLSEAEISAEGISFTADPPTNASHLVARLNEGIPLSELDIRDDVADSVTAALDIASHIYEGEGEHHILWRVDQMVRHLTGCPTVTKTATDARGNEYEYPALGESQAYRDFVDAYEEPDLDPDSGDEYITEWPTGIVP